MSMKAAAKDNPVTTPMAKDQPIDPKLVRELAKLLTETDLTEIEVEKGDLRIRVARHISAATVRVAARAPGPAAQAPVAPHAAPGTNRVEEPPSAGSVTSPMVGTAYRRSSPDSKPFVEIGSVVRAGDKILLIE